MIRLTSCFSVQRRNVNGCFVVLSCFQAIKGTLGKLGLDAGKVRVLAAKAKEILGSPDKWNKDNIKELGNLVAGLLPSDLRKIGEQVIKESLQFLKDVDLNLDQVHEYSQRKLVSSFKNLLSQLMSFSFLFKGPIFFLFTDLL